MLSEQEIFEELSTLCKKEGFIHTLVEIYFSDNYCKANEKGNFTVSNIEKCQTNPEKLHRNELNTLLALVIKNNPNFFNDDIPSQELSEEYRNTANTLLENFHNIFMKAFYEEFENFFKSIPSSNTEVELSSNPKESDVFLNEHSVREAIFYSGDGVYDFQYQDLGYEKYINDNPWFIENKKFSIEHAQFIIEAIYYFHHQKIENLYKNKKTISLEAFIYSKDELIEFFKNSKIHLDFSIDEILSFITAFSFNFNDLSGLNKFQTFDDFNPLVAFPFIKLPQDRFLLFDIYTLAQAFYETPFFWLSHDDKYKNIASKHRGDFAENLTYRIFSTVFGEQNVWLNVDLYPKSSSTHSKKDKIGEVDILVNIHGYVLVFQAKSKKLTINARKGNIQQIDSDFSKSIQHAYNQAFECSEILLGNEYIAKIGENVISLPKTEFCVPICVLSEHFPALTMQIRWLLKEKQHAKISQALVLDVFLLDLMFRTLKTPLEFMHFIHSLSNVRKKFLAYTQIDLLAVHINKNLLCSKEDADMFFLEHGFSSELDSFLMQQRRNINILDRNPQSLSAFYRFHDTYWWRLFKYCSTLDTKEKFKFGLALLQCSGNFIKTYNDIVANRIEKLNSTQLSDFTIELNHNHGMTVYVCNTPCISHKMKNQLYNHARLRKYNAKSNLWFALILSAKGIVKYISVLDFKWELNAETQREYQATLGRKSKIQLFVNGKSQSKKIGRNEKCPCNSGKKYKYCCLNRK